MNNDVKQVRLLIVEDNVDQREALSKFFNGLSQFDLCGVASSGQEGLTKIIELNPDVVLCDFIISDFDGFEIIKYVKNMDELKRPKIIILSAIGDANIVRKAYEYGVDYYIVKPVVLDFLSNKILEINSESNFRNNMTPYKSGDSLIKNIVKNIGIPINIFAFNFIVQAIKIMCNNSYCLKEIYYIIAESEQTSPQSVETLIRTAIKKAHELNNKYYRELFSEINEGKCPTTTIFLKVLTEVAKEKINP